MNERKYRHVTGFVRETPWAILVSTLATIRDMIAFRAEGGELTREEIEARIGDGPSSRGAYMAGSVAILPVYGVIVPRASLFSEISGGTSVQGFTSNFRDAVGDKDVSAIVLDINSPGGSTDLIPELAAEIRDSRGAKPIVAVANTRAASAAYWLGSQADELYVTPSGDVGSVGVYAAHEDISALQEKAGIKTTLISAGKHKTEGNPFEPLSAEARKAIQERVDEMYGMFVSDVAAGRGVDTTVVEAKFGQGRMVAANAAVRGGMVDGVATFEQVVGRLMRGGKVPAPPEPKEPPLAPEEGDLETDDQAASSGLSFADEADQALRAFGGLVNRAEALRALTGRKREQLEALVERVNGLLATSAPLAEAEDELGLEDELAWFDTARR